MKMTMAPIAVLMLLLAGGCGGDTHESLAGESMAATKDMISTLDGVKDQESAKSAKPKLKSIAERMNSINERQAKLDAPSDDQIKAIDSKYSKEMEELQMKMTGHMMRIAFDPKIAVELSDIDEALKKSGG